MPNTSKKHRRSKRQRDAEGIVALSIPVADPEDLTFKLLKKKLRPGVGAVVEGLETRYCRIPLWEEKWDKAALEEKLRAMTRREYDRSLRQLPISQDELLWNDDDIERALDTNLVVPTRVDDFWAQARRYAGVDLAIAAKESDSGSYFAVVSLAITRDGHRYVMNVFHEQGVSFQRQCEIVADLQTQYRYDQVKVEKNGYQDALRQVIDSDSFREQHASFRDIPVSSVWTDTRKKTDLEVGVPSMAAEFERGLWHIPYGDARSRRIMEPLVDELHSYPSPGHATDCVMAMFFAREANRSLSGSRPKFSVIRL